MRGSARFLVLTALLPGCATLATTPGQGPVPQGVRVYPPRVLLLVDAEFDGGKGRTTVLVVPDLGQPYDVRPVTVLARNDFRVEVEDGMLKSLQSGQDTTAALSLVKSGAETAARAGGVGVSARDLEGSYGLPTGFYVLRPDGTFALLQKGAR